MIPISDENPTRARPYATWTLILVCVLVFFWQLSFSEDAYEAMFFSLGFVPDYLFGGSPERAVFGLPLLTLLTSMFLHGGFWHLGGNMLYLWIFGNNVEDAMGRARFLLFYFACGIAAALSQGLAEPHALVPMVGASGAISEVLAGYVLIYPRARIRVLIPLGILLYPMKISAFYVVGFWFLLQVLNAANAASGQPGTAWFAHVGGFAAGMFLTPALSRFPLFGRYRAGPWG